jgi:hypothetical protein
MPVAWLPAAALRALAAEAAVAQPVAAGAAEAAAQPAEAAAVAARPVAAAAEPPAVSRAAAAESAEPPGAAAAAQTAGSPAVTVTVPMSAACGLRCSAAEAEHYRAEDRRSAAGNRAGHEAQAPTAQAKPCSVRQCLAQPCSASQCLARLCSAACGLHCPAADRCRVADRRSAA